MSEGDNKQHILVSNDDGYDAPGIVVLAEAMRAFGSVSIVAPARNHSGASSAITLHNAIALSRPREGLYVVEGTPADCVHLILSAGLLPTPPTLVVSGINAGSNLGNDTIYSGTVAAAIEGYNFGVPSVAFSLSPKNDSQEPPMHYATAAHVAAQIIQRYFSDTPKGKPAPAMPFLLNVNVPDVPLSEFKGIKAARLGQRHAPEPCVFVESKDKKDYYRIGDTGAAQGCDGDTDFHYVREGYAAVTPMATDLTEHQQIDTLGAWLGS